MTLRYTLLLIMVILASPKIHADTKHQLFSTFSHGKSASYETTFETLSKLPKWDSNGEPPISIGNAVEIAKKQYLSDYNDSSVKLDEIGLESKEIGCNIGEKCSPILWYYDINLSGQFRMKYVVFMDGSLIKPIFEKANK